MICTPRLSQSFSQHDGGFLGLVSVIDWPLAGRHLPSLPLLLKVTKPPGRISIWKWGRKTNLGIARRLRGQVAEDGEFSYLVPLQLLRSHRITLNHWSVSRSNVNVKPTWPDFENTALFTGACFCLPTSEGWEIMKQRQPVRLDVYLTWSQVVCNLFTSQSHTQTHTVLWQAPPHEYRQKFINPSNILPPLFLVFCVPGIL